MFCVNTPRHHGNRACWRDHSVYAASQWETALQCTAVSHWLSANTEWSLLLCYLPRNGMYSVLHTKLIDPIKRHLTATNRHWLGCDFVSIETQLCDNRTWPVRVVKYAELKMLPNNWGVVWGRLRWKLILVGLLRNQRNTVHIIIVVVPKNLNISGHVWETLGGDQVYIITQSNLPRLCLFNPLNAKLSFTR